VPTPTNCARRVVGAVCSIATLASSAMLLPHCAIPATRLSLPACAAALAAATAAPRVKRGAGSSGVSAAEAAALAAASFTSATRCSAWSHRLPMTAPADCIALSASWLPASRTAEAGSTSHGSRRASVPPARLTGLGAGAGVVLVRHPVPAETARGAWHADRSRLPEVDAALHEEPSRGRERPHHATGRSTPLRRAGVAAGSVREAEDDLSTAARAAISVATSPPAANVANWVR
jgi:hypothetical protein